MSTEFEVELDAIMRAFRPAAVVHVDICDGPLVSRDVENSIQYLLKYPEHITLSRRASWAVTLDVCAYEGSSEISNALVVIIGYGFDGSDDSGWDKIRHNLTWTIEQVKHSINYREFPGRVCILRLIGRSLFFVSEHYRAPFYSALEGGPLAGSVADEMVTREGLKNENPPNLVN